MGTTRDCAHCGEPFEATQEYSSFKRKYCSPRCTGLAQTARAIATYPPKEEVERLYVEDGLSDLQLGRHYGRSHQWAFKMRRHYGIAGASIPDKVRKPLRRKNDRSRWGIHLKREPVCRSCKHPPGPGQVLNLHHAIPRSLAPSIKYDLRNGLPLCPACHLGWHRREVIVYRDAFTAEEWDFLSTLTFQGFNPEAWLEERYPSRT